jgi:hypothetical protein
MAQSISAKQKKRGRPATGVTPMIGLRVAPELRKEIEVWGKKQHDGPHLSEAIRRLVELGLASARPAGRQKIKAAAKSSAIAGEEIDRRADQSVTDEQRAKRAPKT